MSKLIKDYREAMDSVKISDSFYKRTETLLSELPETKLTSVPPTRRWLPTVLTAAAACFIFIFGIRLITEGGREVSDISTETITVTVSETVTETELPETAAPLVDAFEEDDLEKIMTEAEEAAKEENSEKDRTEREKTEKDKQKQEKTNKTENDGQNTAALGNASPDTAAESVVDKGSADGQNLPDEAGASGAEGSEHVYGQEYEEDEMAEGGESSEEPLPAANGSQYEVTGFSASVLLAEGTSYNDITVKMTPYFTMDGIKSGRTNVTAGGSDCKDILDFISDAVSRSPETENISDPTAEKLKFRLEISETATGKTLCTVQLSGNGRLITDSSDGTKKVCVLSSADREVLEHILFLRFASEEDYEKYLALE